MQNFELIPLKIWCSVAGLGFFDTFEIFLKHTFCFMRCNYDVIIHICLVSKSFLCAKNPVNTRYHHHIVSIDLCHPLPFCTFCFCVSLTSLELDLDRQIKLYNFIKKYANQVSSYN